jgi:hypothetical protein
MPFINYDSVIQTQTTVLANALQALATKGAVHQLGGYNAGPDQFLQVHDAASAPANGAVPAITFKIFGGANFYLTRELLPMKFSNGIYICNSTTVATKTLGAADCWINAQISQTE